MIATEAILVIAFCLAVVAVIGIRIALSLADIEKSLDRVARALEGRASDHAPNGAVGRAATAGDEAASGQARPIAPGDSELAAAIAVAARYRKAAPAESPAAKGPAQAPRTSIETADDGNGIVDAAAERT
jgi:hypothetical protein